MDMPQASAKRVRWTSCRRSFRAIGLAVAAVCGWLVIDGTARAQTPEDFFESRIRPILLEHCQECHSTQSGKTSGGLALDTKEGWQTGGDSGAAVLPGNASESLLIRAVRHLDGASPMPPPEKAPRLSDSQIADLIQWVDSGAHDPRVANARIGGMDADEARSWWAFQPVDRRPVPDSDDVNWASGAIDRFIYAKWKEQGLIPGGNADRRTLLRRATFDLTGLPPTLQQIEDFVSDQAPDAWERLIDRLLASPAYGQRWGRHWLDVARYADTAGDGADYPVREAWKYRNWVIDALNRDLPVDEFIRWQVAGDILANDAPESEYADRVTATGFWAVGKRYGYAPNAAFQHLDFADAIDSMGRSFLGLSLGCARCHDHKYDPVTARDYYALYGILQSTTWAFPGGEEQKRPSSFPPLLPPQEAQRLDAEKAARLAEIDRQIAHLRNQKGALDGSSFAGGVDLALEKQPLGQPPSKPWLSAGPCEVSADAQSPFAHVHPPGSRGVRLGSGQPNEGLRYVFEHPLHAEAGKTIHFTLDFRTVAGDQQPGAYRFYLGRGVVESLAVECSVTQTEFAVRSGEVWEVVRALEPGQWYTLNVTLDRDHKTYSGLIASADDATRFEDKALGPRWDGVIDTFICDAIGHVAGSAPARDLDNFGLQVEPFSEVGGRPAPLPEASPDRLQRLATVDATLGELVKQREAAAAVVPYEVAYGVSEGKPVDARLQRRGEPDNLDDAVPRRFIEILGGDTLAEPAAGSGRRELAQWLTRPSNPLTARVFVNRVWQWHFGTGIVATSSDFGTRGELPTHPELLDYLAHDFVSCGWDGKRLHRAIMLSSTYQLSSEGDVGNLKTDPANRLYWQFSRAPLDAESIRDAMLAVSGTLDNSSATGHPFPPVETWAFTIHQPFHAVYDSPHRSVYLMLQRNRRHPYLALFDAADPNQSVAERLPTTTPTQTLYLMNSPFVHEQSEAFARRLLREAQEPAERARLAFDLAHTQRASPALIERGLQFVDGYRAQLKAIDMPVEEIELKAWAAFARVLLSSNAFLYVD